MTRPEDSATTGEVLQAADPALFEALASAERMLEAAAAQPTADESRLLLQAATSLRDTAARDVATRGLSPTALAALGRRLEAFDRRRFEIAKRLVAGRSGRD